MKRWTTPLLIAISAVLAGLLLWNMWRTSMMERELAFMGKALITADSLAQQAQDARWYAERQRDKSDGVLEDLKRAYPELERRAKEIEVERNVALTNAIEARKQERAKQVALEGERTARVDEVAQRHIAEARADSIAREKRISDNLRLRQRASVLAQNSMAEKGRPEFRGLMAVHALRSMEQAGGDKNKEELVRALRSALEELERASPVRVTGFKRPPHQLAPEKGTQRFLALGHDGLLYRVNMDNMKSSMVQGFSGSLEPGTGHSFLSSDNNGMILTDLKGNISAYQVSSGSLIAKSNSGSPSGAIRRVASWPGLDMVITGDAQGCVQPWRKEGTRFTPLERRVLGAAVKGMAYDASTERVIVVAASGPVLALAQDGTSIELPLPAGQSARCIASAGGGIMVIGTETGAILWMNIREERMTVLQEGDGRRVEVITSSTGAGRVAYVNAVKELVVLSSSTNEPPVRMALEAIPGALALGVEDALYLAFGDRIERVLCSSRSMANRICELIGRTWSPAEWKEIGETGIPEPTCAGF